MADVTGAATQWSLSELLADPAVELIASPPVPVASQSTLEQLPAEVCGRTQATATASWPRPEPVPDPEPEQAEDEQQDEQTDDVAVAPVVALPLFDARKEDEKWW